MRKIPVVFSTDDSYVFPTCVTILSMLKNKSKDTEYEISILISDSLTNVHRDELMNIAENYDSCSISLIEIPQNVFRNSKSKISHISNVAFYRLIIAEVFPQYDKCIYVDGDMIILDDLSAMYDYEMSDYYIAGVKNYRQNQKKYEHRAGELGIQSMQGYIVGAPILFNCKKIREDKLTSRFLEEIEKGYSVGDQDVLNICCYGKILHLPLRMNLLTRFIGLEELLTGNNTYSQEERREAAQNPLLIHYAGRVEKPWVNSKCKGFYLWWEYANMIEKLSDYDKFKKKLKERKQKCLNRSLINSLKGYDVVCIWGETELAERMISIMHREHIEYCVTDNKYADGQLDDNTRIRPQEAIQMYGSKNVCYVITSQTRYSEISNQLIGSGISQNAIVSLLYKNCEYYISLDKKYFDEEVTEILEMEGEHEISERLIEKYWMRLWCVEPHSGLLE